MEHLPRDLASSGAPNIKKQLESIAGGKILDVATQGGSFIRTLVDLLLDYDSFIGIDISREKWDDTRFSDHPVQFLEMNAELLEFNDSSFDTVSISHSLHHLTSIEKVLAEMERVLRPNGYFILQEMFRDEPQSEAQKSDILCHHWGAKIDSLLGIPHNKTLTIKEIKLFASQLKLNLEFIIESTHSVSCILCDDKYKCDNPKNTSIINLALKEVDRNLDKLQKGLDNGILEYNSSVKELLLEGAMIKKRINQYGSASASHLFFIGRK